MNVLEAAREVQKSVENEDNTRVLKDDKHGSTVKVCSFGLLSVAFEDGSHEHIPIKLLDAIDFDFQPVPDPTKLKVDDPIEVSETGDADDWNPRHFAKHEDGKVWAWENGCTKWTAENRTYRWNYWRLPESK